MNRNNLEQSLKCLCVLYVEDEPLLREEVSAFLKRRVQKLYVAQNGLEALEILDDFPVDAVITDLLMPQMDGIQLSEEIRRRKMDLPILIATAINDISVMQSAIALGIDRYLIKPLDIEVLLDALNNIAQKKLDKAMLNGLLPTSLSHESLGKLEAEVAKLIKSGSGKGPDKVTVLVQANLLEIVIKGSRTKLEQTLLTNEDNCRIVDFLRESYYRHLKDAFKDMISEQTKAHGHLQQIICDSKRDVDQLKWIMD
jgi:CheY-like chemotaxis protein/uncharacterized protein YbcI